MVHPLPSLVTLIARRARAMGTSWARFALLSLRGRFALLSLRGRFALLSRQARFAGPRTSSAGLVRGIGTAVLMAGCGLPAHAIQLPMQRENGVDLRAGVVGVVTRADPAIAGRVFTEAYLVHPLIGVHARAGAFAGHGTFNFEGLTLERGELAAGNAGEGYVDRRHPHTYVHELVGTAYRGLGPLAASLTAGRGFAPFGTDDPMVRPFIKYPTNHHLAQILERWIVVGAVSHGQLAIEAALFNGDEPYGAGDFGRLDRFGDSWSLRATVRPRPWLEMQASRAIVTSPEHDGGGGLDQRKWSVSLRLQGREGYALAEWARTGEWGATQRAFLFRSVLIEGARDVAGWTAAARFERTTRPEEERLRNGFRSARPHGDENIIGITRWTTTTVSVGRRLEIAGARIAPFVEAAHGRVRETSGSIFEPSVFYGSESLWTLSLGVRLGGGARHERMGRYGVALPGH